MFGLTGVGLGVVATLLFLWGGDVDHLNLVVAVVSSILGFAPAATAVGILGIVFSVGGLRRTAQGPAHRQAATALFLSIVAAGTVVVLAAIALLA